MRKRRKKKKPIAGILAALLVVALLAVLCAGLLGTQIYMRHTGEDFFTAFGHTARLGVNYLWNLVSPSGHSVPVNPYKATDYYSRGGLLHCAASEVSRAGIDVSSHQKEINWQEVADAGVEFAIVRVGYRGYTDGNLFPDSLAKENLDGALAAGLDVGVYFFSQATSEEEAVEEARFVLDAVEGYELRYPVYYDWEGIIEEARTDDVTGEEMTAFARAFCEEIEAAGYRAGVYFNQSYGYNSFDLHELRDYEFWLAEYADTQSFAYEVRMWQYDCEATLPGIETTIDLNLCYYDYLKEEAPQDDGAIQEE